MPAHEIRSRAPQRECRLPRNREPVPAPAGFDPGASHGADQAYLWPTPTSVYDRDKLRLSVEMVRYWGAFAAAQHCDLWSSIDYTWLDIDPAQQVGVGR